jgi:hypothetical protein
LRIHAMGGVGPLARRPGPVQDRRPLIAGAADAVPFRWPAVGGGRVLSADHAPQTPQAPSEDVSAATRPSTVLARPGATARVAVRERLLPPRPQLLRRVDAPPLSAGVSRHPGLAPRWRANGCVRVFRRSSAAGRWESDWERDCCHHAEAGASDQLRGAVALPPKHARAYDAVRLSLLVLFGRLALCYRRARLRGRRHS